MGLFSSSSKSTSNYNDYSRNVSSTLGDFSDENIIASGDVTYNGLTSTQIQSILDNNLALTSELTGTNQTVLSKAIDNVNSAYKDAMAKLIEDDSETKKILTSLQPFALYGAVGLVAYYLLKG